MINIFSTIETQPCHYQIYINSFFPINEDKRKCAIRIDCT